VSGFRGGVVIVGGISFVLAIFAAPAQATTRADWVAQVDPICQNGQAQEQALVAPVQKATNKLLRQRGRNKKVERRFDRAFRAYFQQSAAVERAVNAQIASIPPAPDDVSLVQVWLRARGELSDSESNMFTGGKKSKKGINRVFTSILGLLAKQLEVNDLIRDFGFQYCNKGNPEIQIIV
jgi:hypothetical protein